MNRPPTKPPSSDRRRVPLIRALGEAGAVWLVVLVVSLVAGLSAGVWRLSDLWTTPWSAELGLVAYGAAGTALLVGAPVVLYRRYGLVLPLVGLVAYLGYWVVVAGFSVGNPARGPFYAFLYSVLFVGAVPVLAAVEYVVRYGLERVHEPTT